MTRLRQGTTRNVLDGNASNGGASPKSETSSPQKEALVAKLTEILKEPFATRAFKDYLVTVKAAELLLFYLDSSDFNQMFTAVLATESRRVNTMITSEEAEAHPDQAEKDGRRASSTRPGTPDTAELISRNFHYFLTRANKIYDKYLKLGSNLRVSK